ncbi:MAG TPA: segregation/condensation protein A [Phycisphaerales bacterium]|nr:segregation/condensation protein A [Phycisphaerales bacterium]
MPLQEDYQVSLDSFHGPLDLLLYLIRRAEVDINDIPIAVITDQYLSFLAGLKDIDVEEAGEFLVMAATLIEIKSRTLMPIDAQARAAGESPDGAPDSGLSEIIDPKLQLVQQLLAYQRYRIAGEDLERQRIDFWNRFARRPAKGEAPMSESDVLAPAESALQPNDFEEGHEAEPIELELEDVHILDLAEAFERIMATIDFTRLGDHLVEMDDTPIALHQEDLLDRLTRSPENRLTLQETFGGRTSSQRIGLFLATLELVRLRRVIVRQDEITAPVLLELIPDQHEALVIETDPIAHFGELSLTSDAD